MSLPLLQQPALEGASGQHLRTLAQRLSAYIPVTLTRKILQDEPIQPGQAEFIVAATMLADMSGFTQMAESLAVNGARGTEALSRALLMTFTSLINAIHDAGGDVSHFHGDAMMIYFPDVDGKAASRALASAQFMQRLMQTNFAEVNMMQANKPEENYALSIKIGVGYGRCVELLVGDAENMEFVLAGTAVDEAVAAQMQADARQVVASEAALKAASLPATGPFRLVDELPPVPNVQEGLFWEAYEQPALMRLVTAVPAFIPPSLFERLQDRNSQSISEHRSVTSMFVQFEGIDFNDPTVGEKLQSYYQWAWQMVQRYGGPNSRVNRVLTGDKGSQLHILFGAPIAPDVPEQALRCALALHQKRPDFIRCQRIGLTAGRVFAGAVGSLNRREYTVVGRMVNLSAQLTQICPPDTILIDAETAARVQTHIECRSLTPISLKGHRDPVPIFEVLAEQTAVTQAQARFQQWQQPPTGRDDELAQLFARMKSALAGKGGLIAVHGSYGSGQMPFLAAGVRYWLQAGGRALVGVSQQHTSDVPYAPWVSIWRDFFELSSEMNAAEQVQQVIDRIAELTPEATNGLSLWRELLGASLRSTALLVHVPAVVRQMRLFKLVQKSVMAAVQERPYLIVLEDIHLADPASLDLLDALSQHSQDLPLLLLVTYRSGNEFNFHTLTRDTCSQIALNDFTPRQARNLIRQELGTDQLPLVVEQRLGLRDRQGRESAVNPLFLEETLQLMRSLQVMAVEKNNYGEVRVRIDESRLAQMEVSDTIYTLLLARLDQLPAAERGLLQFASVIGREFDLATLVAISSGLTREAARELLDTLVQTDLLQQLSGGLMPTYLFQHNLVHQVVYQSLSYARRQSLHATIADFIIRQTNEILPTQYPVLAYHFSQTNQHEDGLKYALLAAEDAETEHNYRGAAEFYKQAVQHLEALGAEADGQTAVAIKLARVRTLLRLGRFNQAWTLADEALALFSDADSVPPALSIYTLMAEIRLRQGEYREVPIWSEKVINARLPHVPPGVVGQAYLLWGQSLTALANWPAATEKLAQAEALLRQVEDPTAVVPVLIAQAELHSQQNPIQPFLEPLQKVADLLQDEANPLLSGWKERVLSRIQLHLGRTDLALVAAQTAVTHLRSAGANALAHGLVQRASVRLYLGQFDSALADLQRADDLFDNMDDALGQRQLYLLWGVAYYGGLGDWQEARQRLAHVGQLFTSSGGEEVPVQEKIQFWLGFGNIARQTGQLAEAKSMLQNVLTAVSNEDFVWWQPAALLSWGLLLLEQASAAEGENGVAEAHQSFRRGLQAVEAGGCPDELPLILLQLGLTAQKIDDARCWHYLETAVQAANQRSRYADRLYVLRRAGEALSHSPQDRLRQLGQEALAQFG